MVRTDKLAAADLQADLVELVEQHRQQTADPQHHRQPGAPGNGALDRAQPGRVAEGDLQHLDTDADHDQRHQRRNRDGKMWM